MIEVFKTNVEDDDLAHMLLDQIHRTFVNYKANFDLQDCDNILRVKSTTSSIQCDCLINLLRDLGFHAEVLTDEHQPAGKILWPN
ncbi:MAG: hypothetical protein H7122_07955 [Chitinophagaceae bacterium]|nr:hypothetical protein [Chitinophagaceae bacterium]